MSEFFEPSAAGAGRVVAGRVQIGPGARAFVQRSVRALVEYLPLIGAIACGVTVRAVYVVGADFPLNDGGMFYSAVQDLKASHYALPEYMSYNGGQIPFAYPPLGLYIAAAFSSVPGISVLAAVRFLPLLFSCLTLAAFYPLARTMLHSRRQAFVAVWVFALLPRAFDWEIVGGGLTRSPGFLFALVALTFGYRALAEDGSRRQGITCGLATGLALLAHLEMAWFVAASLALFTAMHGQRGRFRSRAATTAGILVVAVAVSSPWWVTNLVRFGADPFLAAASTGGHSSLSFLAAVGPSPADETLFPVLTALALLGVLIAANRRDYWLAVWPLVLFIADPRKASTSACVPLALLAAMAVCEGIGRVLAAQQSRDGDGEPPMSWTGRQRAFGYCLMGFGYLAALLSPISPRSPLHSLSPPARDSIAWIVQETEPGSRFAVVTGNPLWATDAASEWFPALTGRVSIATPQGREWLRNPSFKSTTESFEDLQACHDSGLSCLDEWQARTGATFGYVLVTNNSAIRHFTASKQSVPVALAVALGESPDYELVFRNSTTSIYRRASGADNASSAP